MLFYLLYFELNTPQKNIKSVYFHKLILRTIKDSIHSIESSSFICSQILEKSKYNKGKQR